MDNHVSDITKMFVSDLLDTMIYEWPLLLNTMSYSSSEKHSE